VPSGADALTQKVAAFRHGLDPNKISDANGMPDHSGLFDLALANALYVTLLGPVEASSPRNAYAAFWEPFALIGEGASH
jgi:hypothetical protein